MCHLAVVPLALLTAWASLVWAIVWGRALPTCPPWLALLPVIFKSWVRRASGRPMGGQSMVIWFRSSRAAFGLSVGGKCYVGQQLPGF